MFSSLLLAQVRFPQNVPQPDVFAEALIPAIIVIILTIVIMVALWVVFEKAGEPGWAAIVPIYNIIVLLKVAGKPAWWVLLFICPCVNIIVSFVVWYSVAQRFGQGTGFSVATALFPFICVPILAFGGAKFEGDVSEDDRPRSRRRRDDDEEKEEEDEDRPRRRRRDDDDDDDRPRRR